MDEHARFLFVYGWATIDLLLIWFAYRVLSGRWSIVGIFEGKDGRPSTSKFQFLLWTIVVLFGYLLVYLARVSRGAYYAIDEIPANLLIAMGFSGVTAAAAKGITASFVNSGQVNKPDVPPATGGATGGAPPAGTPKKTCKGMACIVLDDEGFPDLSKIQLVAWTLIAIGIYVNILVLQVKGIIQMKDVGQMKPLAGLTPTLLSAEPLSSKISLPDISPALMVLMGLGQGAYLGKKLVTTDTPRLTGVTPTAGRPGSEIILTGQGLGEPGNPVVVTIDGEPIAMPSAVTVAQAGATGPTVKLRFPEKRASGADWQPGAVSVGVLTSGQESANRVPFTVILKPIIDQIVPTTGKANTEVTITGQGIAGAVLTEVLIDDGKGSVTSEKPSTAVNGNEVKFRIPAAQAAGLVQIGLKVDGHESATRRPFNVTA